MPVGQAVLHEIRKIGLISLYFLVCFSFFLTLKKLLLEQYHVSIYVLHGAIIGALVVAKVVVLLEDTAVGRYFEHDRLITHVVWRSLVYTLIVFLVTLIEHLIRGYVTQGSWTDAARIFWTGKQLNHYLALNLSVALSFFIYNTARELDRRLGRGSLRRLLFARDAARPGERLAQPEKRR